ncbi:MAG: hypothetical protein E7593_02075 [Ruminococcaceae bacterium]|nr:hypothetical protein [Oscillospiraceae bacterium]
MKKRDWNEGLNHIDSNLIEDYTKQKDVLRQNKAKRKSILRFGAIAACFTLIFGMIIFPMLLNTSSGIVPYLPNGEPWSPVMDSNVSEVVLSADEIAELIDSTNDYWGTNQYEEIHTIDPEYLYITPLPETEYLPIYKVNNSLPSKKRLEKFINKYSEKAELFSGFSNTYYEIEKTERYKGEFFYRVEIFQKSKILSFVELDNLLKLRYYTLDADTDRLKINGNFVSVLESDTDEEIKIKLKDTIQYICSFFNKKYTDIKIYREYRYDQLETLKIYLYTPEKTIFPSNFSESPMTSEFISLTFDWEESKDEGFLREFSLQEAAKDWDKYFKVNTKGKMISLEAAEELLEKGYVFGGHSCPLCMAAQPEVDFSDYDFVEVEYVRDRDRKIYIPFYAFYKYVRDHDQESGIKIYAKTYVPAIKVSGLDAYFQIQAQKH